MRQEMLKEVEKLIKEEPRDGKPIGETTFSPFFYENKISLQFCGWAIVLLEDGTWFWEDTSGG